MNRWQLPTRALVDLMSSIPNEAPSVSNQAEENDRNLFTKKVFATQMLQLIVILF